MSRIIVVLSGVALSVLASGTLASGEQENRAPSGADVVAPTLIADPIIDVPVAAIAPVVLDEPVFPVPPPKDRVQIWLSSFFAPPTDFNGVDLGLASPEIRVRGRVPVSRVASVQLTASFGASLYDTKGGASLFADCPDCPSPRNLYSAALVAQGGYLLNRRWHLFRSDEQWAALGAVYGSAKWEPGAFEESLSPGVSLGLGYQWPSKLRIALGVEVARAFDGSGVAVGPYAYMRWDITSEVRLRSRGLGVQLEYEPTDRLQVFATAFQSGDRFRLDDRPELSSGPTFSDRQVRAGGGLVFKIAHAVRLMGEVGAIVDREISIDTRDDGTDDSTDGDISPYFSIRAEIRP